MYMMVGHLTFDEATDTLECDFRLEAPKVAGREVCAKSDGILFFLAPEGIPAIRLWLRLRAKLLASKGRADHGHLFVSDGLSHALFSHSLLLSLALTALHTTPPPSSPSFAADGKPVWYNLVYKAIRRMQQELIGTSANPHSFRHMQVGAWRGGWVGGWVGGYTGGCSSGWTGGGMGCMARRGSVCVTHQLNAMCGTTFLLSRRYPKLASTRERRAWGRTRAGAIGSTTTCGGTVHSKLVTESVCTFGRSF
jgi:hypothetical protein